MLNQLPPEKKTFINLWKLGISIIFLLIAMIVVTLIQGEKDTANKNHILRMSAY